MSYAVYSPNITDFTSFLRGQVGIGAAYLPDGSATIQNALTMAQSIVNHQINHIDSLLYVAAVYNLGADNIVNYAIDQPGETFFHDKREELGINAFAFGVPGSVADSGTSVGLMTPEAVKNLMLSDLQHAKTPWGRAYLAIAQRCGSQWGLS